MEPLARALCASLLESRELNADEVRHLHDFLSRHGELDLLARLAHHPALPPEVDQALGAMPEVRVRVAWISRPGRSPEDADRLVDSERRVTVLKAVARVSANPHILRALTRRDNVGIAAELARRDDVPQDVRLCAFRTLAAARSRTQEPSTLLHQALRSDPEVIAAVADVVTDPHIAEGVVQNAWHHQVGLPAPAQEYLAGLLLGDGDPAELVRAALRGDHRHTYPCAVWFRRAGLLARLPGLREPLIARLRAAHQQATSLLRGCDEAALRRLGIRRDLDIIGEALNPTRAGAAGRVRAETSPEVLLELAGRAAAEDDVQLAYLLGLNPATPPRAVRRLLRSPVIVMGLGSYQHALIRVHKDSPAHLAELLAGRAVPYWPAALREAADPRAVLRAVIEVCGQTGQWPPQLAHQVTLPWELVCLLPPQQALEHLAANGRRLLADRHAALLGPATLHEIDAALREGDDRRLGDLLAGS
ncbi:hypothetical protein [Bailinhaonella thermotolerans]|uniref:Uncharacterized protein n=1 Tax=Bailinhaonella thermotolerans TaxID=1070861 RepID=A0A3A4AD77_9ACTN|nr:hypothetical protein [Bailinhaonella thermotolerans]RJL24010.1 hypothetical protein D5H75_31790 [Bailinhaonella thermotolerans]